MSRTEITAVAGIAGSILAVALVLAAPWHGLALAGALVLTTVPGGAAVMCWIDAGDGAAQAGLTVAISVSALAIGAAIMIWAAAWHPRLLLALAVAGTVSCAARLTTSRLPLTREPTR